MALAITEAFAGSDVGGLQTEAVRDGDYWIVTGTKKLVFCIVTCKYTHHVYSRRWITNGTFADYFTTGVKTEVDLANFEALCIS